MNFLKRIFSKRKREEPHKAETAPLEPRPILVDEFVSQDRNIVVGTAQSRPAMAADGVNLVHKDDARRIALGLLE